MHVMKLKMIIDEDMTHFYFVDHKIFLLTSAKTEN